MGWQGKVFKPATLQIFMGSKGLATDRSGVVWSREFSPKHDPKNKLSIIPSEPSFIFSLVSKSKLLKLSEDRG